VVVNIDNGFGAAVAATRIARGRRSDAKATPEVEARTERR
jgi:hypothetical protein